MIKFLCSKIINLFNRLASEIFGKKISENVINYFAHVGRIDLLTFAYNKIGVLNYENDIISGESFLLEIFLKKRFSNIQEKLIIFDIGANTGEYSEKLSKEFPKSKIYAFEPTPEAYQSLKKRQLPSNVTVLNMGFGSKTETKKIYSYANDSGSQHSSTFKEVFTDLHHEKNLVEINFSCTTIDDFCDKNAINYIDFIKIDTEGNEFDILTGSLRMIKEDKIKYIQFEFNEMNIISRVFLRDFYQILPQYDFYRLSETKLIPLGKYNSSNEIFKFQNILAVNRKIQTAQ